MECLGFTYKIIGNTETKLVIEGVRAAGMGVNITFIVLCLVNTPVNMQGWHCMKLRAQRTVSKDHTLYIL